MKCPMCGLEFDKSAKIYRKFYYRDNDKEIKVAFRERHCPYCGYTLSTKKVDYDKVKATSITEEYWKIIDRMKQIRKKIDKLFNELLDIGAGW